MGSKRLTGAVAALIVCALLACSPVAAARTFRPRIGGALGIVPPAGSVDIATGSPIPVVYHGGAVMHGVTIHSIFWAPSGYRFTGSPGPGVASYEQLIQRFLTGVANDSGTAANVFSLLSQYPDQSGPAGYRISYSAAADSIDDTDPYPPFSSQCASPSGIAVCVTDVQLQQEIDKMIRAHDPFGRGLHDLWFIFLPPDVDTCTLPGQCGTNAFGGYHSLSNLGAGPVIYAVVPDPLIEFTAGPGSDPEGNPDAELALDVIAHETVEAISDPEGNGWMDPNGFEAGDKCETGPVEGSPLGFAPDQSPYNQVIGGDQYLLQAMWSDASNGCLLRSTLSSRNPGLATVDVGQFSSQISGNIGTPARGVPVLVFLVRDHTVVALANATTGAGGSWGPASLLGAAPHGFGDDRDVIEVFYGPAGPMPDLIASGDGGDPFAQSGFTGWFDLDHGYAIRSSSVQLGPCSQTGTLALQVGLEPTAPPVEQCQGDSDIATVATGTLGPGTALTLTSEDDRAVSALNPGGALISFTVPLGEPGAIGAIGNDQVLFTPSGFPSCTAHLQTQVLTCNGLVPHARYTVLRRRGHAVAHATADASGSLSVARLRGPVRLQGGDVVILSNRAHRVLTVLHVAHLRVNLTGAETVVASGRCQSGDYWGPPVSSPPISAAVTVPGVAGAGQICPMSGNARGLPATDIAQTDDLSGGQTITEVPQFEGFSPSPDETLYGPFVALAQVGLPGPNGSIFGATGATVALTITRAASRRRVFFSANVNRSAGVAVGALPPGVYDATWMLRDLAGDTRTVHSRFVEEK